MHRLKWWQLLAIYRGSEEARPVRETTRWLAYVISQLLGASSIKSPKDLQQFPWELSDPDGTTPTEEITEEDIARLQELMRQENAKAAKVNP